MGPVCLPCSMANQIASSPGAGAGAGAVAAGAGGRVAPEDGAPLGAIDGSSFLDAFRACSSRSLSMASVLSVSLSRFAARAAAAAAAGFDAAGAGEDAGAGGAEAGRNGALGAPSAGSEIPILAPQRLQRTIR